MRLYFLWIEKNVISRIYHVYTLGPVEIDGEASLVLTSKRVSADLTKWKRVLLLKLTINCFWFTFFDFSGRKFKELLIKILRKTQFFFTIYVSLYYIYIYSSTKNQTKIYFRLSSTSLENDCFLLTPFLQKLFNCCWANLAQMSKCIKSLRKYPCRLAK